MNRRFSMKNKHWASEDCSVDARRWLTTFNDMITLLMVFFVLLFSMGSLDVKRFKHFQNALQSAMGVLYEGRHAPVGTIDDNSMDNPGKVEYPPQSDETRGRLSLDNTDGLEATYTHGGIHLTLDDRLLFASGSARLTAEGIDLLKKVGRIIKPLERRIRIEGHTDNRPISTNFYPSNWELSTARAISVVKYLVDQSGIDPGSLSAAGYGDSRPREPNDTQAHLARNRRVEIILGPAAEYGNDE